MSKFKRVHSKIRQELKQLTDTSFIGRMEQFLLPFKVYMQHF